MRALPPAVWVLALAVGVGLSACRRGAPEVRAAYPGAPVVLISVDTLRSDRLPAYGNEAVATPAIDRLVRDGILFERAYSHYPITLPSHCSILTGLLPPQHGVRDNVGYRLDTLEVPYLPRLFRARGYATGGAVSVFLLRRDTGLGEGFDFYEDSIGLRGNVSLGESQRPGSQTLELALPWLRQAASGGGPFFFFFHLYEPHTPWDAPEPFASRYRRPYDAEVAAADAVVGELLTELDRLGVYEEAVIVLLSDHGEGLGDHGEMEHGIFLYREALQVPLILKLPRGARAGERVSAVAQLIDVYPTLARLAGAEAREGTSLLELADGSEPRDVYAETYYPRLHLGWSELRSLVSEQLHLIDGPDPELYDLAVDPQESNSLLRTRRRDYVRMRDAIARHRTELVAPGAVDAATRQQLQALGYLSGAAREETGPRPDPKSQIHVLQDLMAAMRAQAQRDPAAAVEGLRRVLATQPEMVDAWQNLGTNLETLGRHEEAEAALRKALELSGGTDVAALALARHYLLTGRYAEARRHAELGLATNPAASQRVLARVALAEEDLPAAKQHARDALVARDSAVEPWVLLAQVAVIEDDLAEAQRLLARAEEAQARRPGEPLTQGLSLTRGDVAARLGRVEEAVAFFGQEIELYPDDARAYANLAVLLALEGRDREAVDIVRRLVEDNQTPVAYAAAVEALRILGDPAGAARLLQHALGRFPGNPKLLAMAAAAGR